MTRRTSYYAMVVGLLLLYAGCTDSYWKYVDSSSRDEWQQPKAVIQSLHVPPGASVADVGSGGGYFSFPLAEAVGPQGKVFAVDVDKGSLDYIRRQAETRGVSNIALVQAAKDDPRLPEHGVDLIFTCNTYHHLDNRVVYLQSLARYLRLDGRVAIIDYTETGWFAKIFGHWTPKETVRREMEAAGYQLTDDFDFLRKQHFQVFRR